MIEPDYQDASIVLVGKFNPAIFSPQWFCKVDLATEKQVEEATVRVIHPEMTLLSLATFDMQIGPERFSVATKEVPFVRLMEFVSNLIGGILPHTPVSAFGINFEEHFETRTIDQKIQLGRKLAPLAPWGDWAKDLEFRNEDVASGLAKLTMVQMKPGGRKGQLSIEIRPSQSKRNGVEIASNDHFVLNVDDSNFSAETAAKGIIENFEQSHTKVKSIFSHIRGIAEES